MLTSFYISLLEVTNHSVKVATGCWFIITAHCVLNGLTDPFPLYSCAHVFLVMSPNIEGDKHLFNHIPTNVCR